MVIPYSSSQTPSQDRPLSGRAHRLLYEWEALEKALKDRKDIILKVLETNPEGLPVRYEVEYLIRCISGVKEDQSPRFHERFKMEITLPERYPQVDAPPAFRFVGDVLPWHPNICYHGEMAGRVCLNMLSTNTDLAWGVLRIALYLRYELYHAIQEPPYPEDLKVAYWVRHYGEPNEWIFYDQDDK